MIMGNKYVIICVGVSYDAVYFHFDSFNRCMNFEPIWRKRQEGDF